MHLTDNQLNEYLDNETTERAEIESHLDSCDECAARFSTLQSLFAEIESLPELTLTHNIAARLSLNPSLTPVIPRWLTLTVILQAVLALVALIIAIPFAAAFIPQMDVTSLTTPLFEIQSLWTSWLDSLSTFALSIVEGFNPQSVTFSLPTLPIMEMSSLLIFLAGVFILWIFGNGLLLRNQNR